MSDHAEILKLLASLVDPNDKHKLGLQLRFVDKHGKPVSAKRKRPNPHDGEFSAIWMTDVAATS